MNKDKRFNSLFLLFALFTIFRISIDPKKHFIRFSEANILGTQILLPRFSLVPLSEESLLEKSFQKDPSGSLNSFLLAEATLNAIRQNYVDKERITPSKLLDYLVSGNEIFPQINIKRDSSKLSITSNSSSLNLPIPRNLNFSHVRNTLVSIANFIDQELEEKDKIKEHKNKKKLNKKMSGINVALNMMLTSLDAHSSFLDKEDYKDLKQGTEGSFGGLGIVVGVKNQLLTVLKPIPNSPAVKAGIDRMDTIVSIDSQDTFGTPLDSLVSNMRGLPGSQVNLSVLKSNALAPVTYKISRDIIFVESVESKTTPFQNQNYLYLKIENFSARTSQEMIQAIENFRKQNLGIIPGMVMDLRSNPGGLLDQAIKVVDYFVKSGVIVSTRGRKTESEKATNKNTPSFPLVVLIDSDSASASEIVAGALQDHKRALVVGQPSFGKASVQTIFEVHDEQALKLTIARYYTPNNRSIQNTGITPDIWLQPILKVDQNENILGPWRYRSERYLRSSLDLGRTQTENTYDPTFKGYYLKPEEPKDIFVQNKSNDYELEFALGLLAQYTKSSPNVEFQSEIAVSNMKSYLSTQITNMTKEVQKFLDNKLKIHWLDLDNKITSPIYEKNSGLEIAVNLKTTKKYTAGEKTIIPFVVTNNHSNKIDELSLFARSDKFGFPTDEVLIPELPAKSSYKGSMTVTIPNYWNDDNLPLSLVLAEGGTPILTSTHTLKFDTKTKIFPNLSTNSTFVDLSGGTNPGKLEPGEKAKFKVTIKNDSKSAVEDMEIKLINLAGAQIEVESEKKTLKKLAPGQTKVIDLMLKGSQRILSDTLKVGLSIESHDLLNPYQKLLTISALK